MALYIFQQSPCEGTRLFQDFIPDPTTPQRRRRRRRVSVPAVPVANGDVPGRQRVVLRAAPLLHQVIHREDHREGDHGHAGQRDVLRRRGAQQQVILGASEVVCTLGTIDQVGEGIDRPPGQGQLWSRTVRCVLTTTGKPGGLVGEAAARSNPAAILFSPGVSAKRN